MSLEPDLPALPGPVGRTELSADDRARAVAAASAARARRALVKAELKSGTRALSEVLTAADTDQVIARMPVVDLLGALPRIGPVRAAELMSSVGIAANRRVGGLGSLQRAALLRELG